jgi:hypothetical protein
MNTQREGTFAIIAALVVLFSALLSPILSATGSIIAMLGYGIYKLVQKEK